MHYIRFVVYALYSAKFDKIYIGFTSNIERRMILHNSLQDKGYTAKYRPWIVIYSEEHTTKSVAMKREKELKSATGRRFIHEHVPK